MPKKDLKVRLRNRKNYLPTFLIALVLWVIIGFIIIRVDPILLKDVLLPDSYLPLLILILSSSFLSFSLILANTRRGILTSIGVTIFLYLRLKGLGNFINAILIFALLLSLDFYHRPTTSD